MVETIFYVIYDIYGTNFLYHSNKAVRKDILDSSFWK
jgi:hypothetical protein